MADFNLHSREDELTKSIGQAKTVTKLERDLFKMQLESVTHGLVRKQEATSNFKMFEDKRVDDLIQVALSKNLTWRTWDNWITERVKADLQEFQDKGEQNCSPVIPSHLRSKLNEVEQKTQQVKEDRQK